MAFWCRAKQSQLRSLSNQFKRCYFQIHGSYSVNHTTSCIRILDLRRTDSLFQNTQFEFCKNIRFFAAPAQFKSKKEENGDDGPRLNEKITAQYIRLVTDEGHKVVSRHEALEQARRLELDLVEVQRTAKPPVCKLMDYHKEKYKKQLMEKDRSKSKSEVTLRKGDCKEVRVEGKIEQKDLQMKADMVKRMMDNGYRVKCTARGSDKKAMVNEDQNLGGLLARFYALIEDVSVVESGPIVEKKNAYVIVRHMKFGQPKKGLKKASMFEATSSEVEEVAASAENINPVSQSPGHDSITPERYPSEAPSGIENRYKKDPRNKIPLSQDAKFTKFDRLQPQYPDLSRNPRQTMQPQQFANQDPAFRTGFSVVGKMGFPGKEFLSEELSLPGASSSPSSRIQTVDAPKVNSNPEPQGVPSEVNRYNRYKKVVNPNSSVSNFNSSRRPDVNRGGHDR